VSRTIDFVMAGSRILSSPGLPIRRALRSPRCIRRQRRTSEFRVASSDRADAAAQESVREAILAAYAETEAAAVSE
jgi:hypothetical protein